MKKTGYRQSQITVCVQYPESAMSVKKEIKYFFIKYFLTFPAYYLLNIYAKTVRVKLEGIEDVFNHVSDGGRVILASWHQRFFAGFYLPKSLKRNIPIMISKSRDGDFIADVVERIGWIPVRGSSSRRGRAALKELVDEIINFGMAGHIVDGPTGPPRVVKPGLISLAEQGRAAICPVFVLYQRPWIFSSWDRFMIPRPFSTVVLRFGSITAIPEDLDAAQFEEFRIRIEKILSAGYETGDRAWLSERDYIRADVSRE